MLFYSHNQTVEARMARLETMEQNFIQDLRTTILNLNNRLQEALVSNMGVYILNKVLIIFHLYSYLFTKFQFDNLLYKILLKLIYSIRRIISI